MLEEGFSAQESRCGTKAFHKQAPRKDELFVIGKPFCI